MSGVDPRISDADALVCAFYKLEFLSAIQQADKLKYCLPPQYLPLIRLNVFFFIFLPMYYFFYSPIKRVEQVAKYLPWLHTGKKMISLHLILCRLVFHFVYILASRKRHYLYRTSKKAILECGLLLFFVRAVNVVAKFINILNLHETYKNVVTKFGSSSTCGL